MKNKGFTLIELLAVIVILAIIALIATPIILNIIKDAKIESTKRSAENYVKAVETEVVRKNLTSEFNPSTCTIDENNLNCDGYVDPITVEIDGEKPTEGTITFENHKAKTYTIGYVGKTVTKAADGKITVSDNTIENVPSTPEVAQTICTPVTQETASKEKTTGVLLGTVPTGEYKPGDEYICEVGQGIRHRFYILNSPNDNGEVDMIMYANINRSGQAVDNEDLSDKGFVEWLSKDDYINIGNGTSSEWDEQDPYFNSGTRKLKGPITALKYLQEVTQNWSNVKMQTINSFATWSNTADHTMVEIKSRARLAMASEVSEESKNYLYDNLNYNETYYPDSIKTNYLNGIKGYWTSSMDNSRDAGIFVGYYGCSRDNENIDYKGYEYDNVAYGIGVRPVITVSKENIK